MDYRAGSPARLFFIRVYLVDKTYQCNQAGENMAGTILLVEDDFALAMGTEYALQAEGYEVLHAANLNEARRLVGIAPVNEADVSSAMPDLVLLDVMLPDGNGYDFCKELRSINQQIPIIFLTAVAEEVNIVQGLLIGADDYVAKPYRVKELLSRITANLRRAELHNKMLNQNESAAGQQPDGSQDMKKLGEGSHRSQRYRFGSHVIDVQEYRLYKDDSVVEVTPGEFRLLKELIQNDGLVLTRNQLLERLYDTGESFVDDNTLSVYMKRLRDKLGEDAQWIETVRGVGYRFKKCEK